MENKESMPFSILSAIIATALAAIFYLFAATAAKLRWGHKLAINPLKITAEPTGRASLSKTQVFFFTLIVLWISIYWVIQEGKLVPINDSILWLLGVAAGGAGLGRAANTVRSRVTGENWAWAKKKRWIKNDFTRTSSEYVPKFSDLVTSDQGFEVARFQAVAFSVVVGISLLYKGVVAAESFESSSIDNSYLMLIGLSQGIYLGGKFVGSNPISELNASLDKVRKLELAFTTAVAKSATWNNAAVQNRDMKLARESVPDGYTAYMSSATVAAEIVGSLTGNDVDAACILPELPPSEE